MPSPLRAAVIGTGFIGRAFLPAGHAQGWGDRFEAFVRDTYAAIRGEAHPGLPTFSDGARSMSIVEAVLRSSATNQWTTISN
jgi:predicted dehydrogenase